MARYALEASIGRDADTVFAYLNDVAHLPEWETGVVEVRAEPPGPPRVGTTVRKLRRTPLGRQIFTGEITEYDAGRRVRAERAIGGPITGATIRWTVAPAGAGALVRVAVDLRASGLWKLLTPFIVHTGRAQLRRELARLKAVLEHGAD